MPAPPACDEPWFAGEWATATSAGAGGAQIALGDLDGDGHVDAVSVNRDGAVRVFRGRGQARFTSEVVYAAPAEAYGVALGDLDGNASLDIAVASQPFGGGPGHTSSAVDRSATSTTTGVRTSPERVSCASTVREGDQVAPIRIVN